MQAFEVARAIGGILTGDGAVTFKSISTDSRRIEKDALFIAIRGERFDGNAYISAAFAAGAGIVIGNTDAVCPEGCAYIKTEDSVLALGRLASYHRRKFRMPVVGVTGSVGKTTTKEMIGAVLSEKFSTLKTSGNFNNAIGLPLTVLSMSEEHEAAVIEMGMSARGEIAYLTKIAAPSMAVITNVGLSHIENLKTQENIRDAKLEIVEGLSEGGILFVNGDDPFLQSAAPKGVKTVRFGFDFPHAEICGKVLSDDSFSVGDTVFTVPVGGKHNLYNGLAAYAVGKAVGLTKDEIKKGLLRYAPDGIRQSEKEIRPGITVICDYYNASPASMRVALEMLAKGKAKRRIAVLGDMLELGELSQACHSEVGACAAEMGADMVLCVGKFSVYAAAEAEKKGVGETKHFPDNDSLAAYLCEILTEGDRVLIKGSHGMKMEEIFEKIR